ncbi:hypothetical protein A0H81_09030 [Grifola frondosa]|uniref:Uncharacterized protein n=1 Tax=Grifola frondosa TaxID=5627 RepID=A0A1C7M2E9_GRIFR|nr:hypothetical protein A0H81_09030 [Grifola frondosa]
MDAESASQSAEASLHGHRALTPILSGAISGGIVGVAWIIGLIVYIFRRVRTSKRAHAAGFRSHRQLLDSPKEVEAFIIPQIRQSSKDSYPLGRMYSWTNQGSPMEMSGGMRRPYLSPISTRKGRSHHRGPLCNPLHILTLLHRDYPRLWGRHCPR